MTKGWEIPSFDDTPGTSAVGRVLKTEGSVGRGGQVCVWVLRDACHSRYTFARQTRHFLRRVGCCVMEWKCFFHVSAVDFFFAEAFPFVTQKWDLHVYSELPPSSPPFQISDRFLPCMFRFPRFDSDGGRRTREFADTARFACLRACHSSEGSDGRHSPRLCGERHYDCAWPPKLLV